MTKLIIEIEIDIEKKFKAEKFKLQKDG